MMEKIALRDLVVFHYGSALKSTERDNSGSYEVFGSNGPVGKHINRLVDYPTIIVGRKGSVGSLYYAPEGGWPIDTTYYIEIKDQSRVHLRFLYYALMQAGLDQHAIITSIPGLNRNSLYKTVIPVPRLPQQRWIADILDKADAIRRKRRAAIQHAHDLIESGFAHYFGNALLNQRGFKMCPLEELVNKIIDCPHSTPTYVEGKTLFHCLRSSDIQDGVIEFKQTRYVTEATYIERIERHKPTTGEVVFTREGGRLGNAAQIPPNVQVCLGQRMMLFGAKPETSTNEFIWGLLNSPGVQHQIRQLTAGAAAPRINISDIRQVKVMAPPFELQQRFSEFVLKMRELSIKVTLSANEIEDLFNALVQRAFQGEL